MKKVLLFLVVTLLSLQMSNAQKAFEKGNFSIAIGAGITGYATKSHYSYDATVWNGSGLSTIRISEDTTDGAVTRTFPVTLEYGVTNWLGIGARVAYNKFFTAVDSAANNTHPDVRSLDADLVIGLHFIKTKRFDLPLNISAGYSAFTYQSNDALHHTAKDGGLNFGVQLQPRIFFGNHIGMYFNVGYANVSYKSMTFSNDNDSDLNDTDNRLYTLKGSGLNVGLGLIAKF